MESFAIACTTCQTQLRVRDRLAIGQILTCPKCGSMVLVEPPAEVAAASPVARPPLPKTNGVANAGASPATLTNLSDTVEDPTMYGIVPGTIDQPRPADVTASQAAEDAQEPAPDLEPIVAADEWSPTQATPWRRWLWMSCAAIAGVGLAVLLFGWLSSGSHSDEKGGATVARSGVDPRAGSPAGDTSPRTAAPLGRTEPAVPAPEKALPTPSSDTPVLPQPLEPTLPATPAPEPSLPTDSPPVNTPPPPPSEPVDGTPGLKPTQDGSAAEQMSSATSLRKTLKSFGSMLEDPNTTMEMPAQTGPAGRNRDLSPRSDMPRPDPLNVDVEARLKDAIEQIEFKGVPLVDFLAFVADYSTIPITLDPDVLPWLRISPESPVTVRQSKTTVADLLTESLQELQLGYSIVDNQLLVTRVAAQGALVREVPFELGDMTGNDGAQLEQIGQLIRELIAPASWKSAGGSGTMRVRDQALLVRHDETILYQVLAFCEKLRVARGLTPRSKLNPALFQLTSRTDKFASRPPTPVSVNCSYPERFVVVVRRLAKDSLCQLLIDWRGAAQMGWNPNAQVQCSINKQPLGEALRALLHPMDLTFRTVDENTLLITSRLGLDSHLDVEFYPARDLLSKGLSSQQLLDQVKTHLRPARLKDNGGLGVLRFDTPSQCLIAALPQPSQQALGKLLAELKEGKKQRANSR